MFRQKRRKHLARCLVVKLRLWLYCIGKKTECPGTNNFLIFLEIYRLAAHFSIENFRVILEHADHRLPVFKSAIERIGWRASKSQASGFSNFQR